MADKKKRTPQGTREARVQHIEGLMRTFKFKRGKTVRDLAKTWGVSEVYCRELSAAASKRIAAAVMEPDAVNAIVGSALEEIIARCMPAKKYREVIEASKAWAHISGAGAPSKQELSGPDGGPVQIATPTIYLPAERSDEDSTGLPGGEQE